ncbi:MAG: 6-O-methylguanine DNA methyltransferase [Phascolarctobacterium sp.]|nr:MAG: 6-O-methylguanine DNA methyltransferase [Phascolarctobacterium sp.]
MQYIDFYASPLGKMTIASNGQKLTGLWFDKQKYFGAGLAVDVKQQSLPIFAKTKKWLDIYFSGRQPDFTPPLELNGSPFRLTVWNLLLQIPYGSTVTYKDLAAKIAAQQTKKAMSAQAIGGAVGHNPISIIIPCHRVTGTNGSLTGYAGGLDKKLELLKLEGLDTSKFTISKG